MTEEKLILDNINLIYMILKKLNLYSNQDEYFDVGMLGLVKGAKKFDESKGYAPSTFLSNCIKNEIVCYIRNNRAKKRNSGKQDISIYDSIYKDANRNELTIIDFMPSKENIEENMINKESLEALYKEISNLNERNKFIICSYYGLLNCEELRQCEIANKLGIAQSTVNRVIKRFIEEVRRIYD